LVSGGEKKLLKKLRRKFAYGDATIEVCKLCNLCGDVKLVDRQRNVSSSVSIPEPKVVFKDLFPEIVSTPEQELKRTETIFDRFEAPKAELTVGDLSTRGEEKRKRRLQDGMRELKNMEEGLSVGALTGMDEDKRDLDQLYSGAKGPQPSMSESQSLNTERYREQKEKVAEQLRIRNLMAGCRDEKLEEYADKFLRNKASESNEPRDKA
jgi:hypothetical protein